MLQAGSESHGSERRQRSTAATARGVHSALWRYHTGPTTRAFFSPRRLAWACARPNVSRIETPGKVRHAAGNRDPRP